MRAMTEWFSGDVVANGIKQHYVRTGGDKPPLVLAHGATDSGLCWTRLARALESDYDVVMPDARGHGLSDAPVRAYGSVEQAADLAALIDALGLDRPAVGGHSMGARTTLRLVADYPDIASCAFLEDPPLRMDGEPSPTPGKVDPREEMRQTIQAGRTGGRDALLAIGRARHPTWADEEFEPWVDAKLHVSDEFMDDLTGRPMDDWRELIGRVRCPLLLITADPERGAIVAPEAAQEAQQLLPSLQVERIGGAGHNIRREQFDRFLDVVRSFLTAYAPAAARAEPS
jgi:N-formylmaleamate deformylase